MAVGIICEYNPFHNGHLHHLNEVKKQFNEPIVLVMSGNFTQRGDISLINKWDKTSLALTYGVDLVVELPFCFATQSADTFSKYSIRILKHLNVDKIVFGSESNDIKSLIKCANTQLSKEYDDLVNKYIKDGISFPISSSLALKDICDIKIESPNDILGVSYIRESILQKTNITPFCIKRTNDFHSLVEDNDIASATSIRNKLINKEDISNLVPFEVINCINNLFIDDYFLYLKYQIINNDLLKFHNIDKTLSYRIKKYISKCCTLEELILAVKTKQYTYNRVKRSLLMILVNYTKEEAKLYNSYDYIRVLGFNETGKNYLNSIKKDLTVELIVKYTKQNDKYLALERRVSDIYNLLKKDKNFTPLETTKVIVK